MVKFDFDLNVAPMDEDGVREEDGNKVWYKAVLEEDNKVKEAEHRDANKITAAENGDDDVCEAPAQKRQRVEDGGCFDPKTPPIEDFFLQKLKFRISCKSKVQPAIKKQKRIKPRRFFKSKIESVAECCATDIDASELIPEYVKINPEFEDRSEVKLIIQKHLTKSDILKQQVRLSIPCGKILTKFLTDSEENWLQREAPNKNRAKSELEVKVVGPCSKEVHHMSLSRWNYKSNGFRYALKGNWFDFKKENKLELGDFIKIVSFRCKNRLCWVIFKPDISFETSPPLPAAAPPRPLAFPAWGTKRERTRRVVVNLLFC